MTREGWNVLALSIAEPLNEIRKKVVQRGCDLVSFGVYEDGQASGVYHDERTDTWYSIRVNASGTVTVSEDFKYPEKIFG